jgi:hypothetical protein
VLISMAGFVLGLEADLVAATGGDTTGFDSERSLGGIRRLGPAPGILGGSAGTCVGRNRSTGGGARPAT